MATIQKILKDGEVVYPITKPECVIDESGKNVLQLIEENSKDYDDTEIRDAIDKKVDSDKVATINGQSLINGGNIVIEGGGSSYDDTEIREELSKKLEGEVVGTTTPTEGSIGGSYDDTEIRQEIAGLSEEVGKKIDADKVATINGQSITNGGNIIIEGGEGGVSTSTKGTGTGSLVQTKEVETFENQAPITENTNGEISVDAVGDNSTVLNGKSHAGAKRALAHGNRTIALGENSHTEGHCTQVLNLDDDVNGYAAHAEGYGTIAAGTYSHAEGNTSFVAAPNAHAEGKDTINLGDSSHTEGYGTYTGGRGTSPDRPVIDDSTSGGDSGTGDSGASVSAHDGVAAHAEGNYTRAYGNYSHAEGRQCDSIGEGSHAEGTETVANGYYSHTEGNKTKTDTNSLYSHAEGINTMTKGTGAHAEGDDTHANGETSHTEGWATYAYAKAAHAEGQNTRAHAQGSHSEGNNTDAKGPHSHAEGIGTKTNPNIGGQHVEGYYNAESDSLKIVGCGTSDEDRKNAIEVTQDGRVFLKGVGNYDGTSLEAKDLATVINEGGQGGESSVFEAEYGVTTYDEIAEAYNAKKHVIVWRERKIYNLSFFDNTSATFTALSTTVVSRVSCKPAGWVKNPDTALEESNNKVTTLSESSTDIQYPSAKAVYDFVNNTLGTIINGDY